MTGTAPSWPSGATACATRWPASTPPPSRRPTSSAGWCCASLGVAGDSDAGVTLVESLDELVAEVVDDLYLRRFGHDKDTPVLTREAALVLAREVVGNPHTTLTPEQPEPGTVAAVRVGFARDVLAELERRKRRLGILGYDDLLTRLAAALAIPDAPARDRMRRRWRIVMVDEFQDTDPVQWQVIERGLRRPRDGRADRRPQAGDLRLPRWRHRHLPPGPRRRHEPPDPRHQPPQRQAAGRPAPGGHAGRGARPRGHRGPPDRGAPPDPPPGRGTAPGPLPAARRDPREVRPHRHPAPSRWTRAREHIARDLAADVKALLASEATYDGRPVRAGDIAVIVEAHRDARVCRDALADAGIPAVYTGDTDVFASAAAPDWLRLLEAFEQPHRSGLVRAAATTMFFGETAQSLAEGGDSLTDRVADTLREWSDHARERGLAAVFEAAQVAGLGQRVLGWQGGERHLTDLAHVAQVLHETAQRERLGLPAHPRLAAPAVQREGARRRAQPAARLRRRRGADHDRVGEQGSAVPPRLPALRLQPQHPRARQPALPPRRQERASTSAARAGAVSGRSRPWRGARWPATTSGSPTSR